MFEEIQNIAYAYVMLMVDRCIEILSILLAATFHARMKLIFRSPLDISWSIFRSNFLKIGSFLLIHVFDKSIRIWTEAMLMYNLHLLYCSDCLPDAHGKRLPFIPIN